MRKLSFVAIIAVLAICITSFPALAGGGFDEFGYNYKARIFVRPPMGLIVLLTARFGETQLMHTTIL